MDVWWKRQKPKEQPATPKKRAVAYYRHSAQDRQENSVPIQKEQVQKWAAERDIEIIAEFADHGKSGLSTEHRDAFNDMIENWVKKRDDFQYVLALDVSRWGRFLDIDLSAVYSAECTKHNKQVAYTTIGMPRKDDPIYSVQLVFERYRAAQYSRELSDKVFKGCVKIAQQGFRAGGMPPYALHRLLLNEARQPVNILNPGERKSIQNQRVTLAPGDEKHVAVVQRIFQSFVDGATEDKIAGSLNQDSILSPGSAHWDAGKVRCVLQNEMYAGVIVYNKTSQRLLSKPKPNPKEEWVRTPDAFQGIISHEIFNKAADIFNERVRIGTRENMLERLRAHYEEYGFIKDSLIRADPKAPSVHAYFRSFGGLDQAFLEAHADVHGRIRQAVRDQLGATSGKLQEWDNFYVLNDCLTVMVQPSVPVPRGCRTYWCFRADNRPEIDVTLGVPLSNGGQYNILGYLALPRLIIRDRLVRLYGPSDSKVNLFGHNGLELLKEVLQ